MYTKLILERVNNKWYIVDDTSPSPLTEKRATAVAQTGIAVTKNSSSDSINEFLNKWLASWKTGDMKSYRNSYVADFKSKNMNLDAWINHKIDVRKKSKNINIRMEKLSIKYSGNNATASFIQHYNSSILKSRSVKKLELKKISGEWKIVKETT